TNTPKSNVIPPTAVGGYFRSFFRKDLNNPPTSVGGIQGLSFDVACRKHLNEPPTAVGELEPFETTHCRGWGFARLKRDLHGELDLSRRSGFARRKSRACNLSKRRSSDDGSGCAEVCM